MSITSSPKHSRKSSMNESFLSQTSKKYNSSNKNDEVKETKSIFA
jgi:hypothetical protein